MLHYTKYIVSILIQILMFKLIVSVHLKKSLENFNSLAERIKRQDGYVYYRPNVAFDLPTRPSLETVTTPRAQDASSQRQQMYYAYPAPAVPASPASETINIGYSSTGIPSTSGTVQSSTEAISSNSINAVDSYSSTANTASSSNVNSGYNYNQPTNLQEAVSTNAPKYLPPTTAGRSASGVTVGEDIGSSRDNLQISSDSSSYSSTGSDLSVTLPTKVASTMFNLPTQDSMTKGPALNTGYLQPNPSTMIPSALTSSGSISSLATSAPSITPSSSVVTRLTEGYLPPFGKTSGVQTLGTISTPAVTYLPPNF